MPVPEIGTSMTGPVPTSAGSLKPVIVADICAGVFALSKAMRAASSLDVP